MREITIGQYYAVDSPIHRLDPRTKLLGVFVYVVLLFAVQNPLCYLPLALTLVLLYRAARLPFGYVVQGLRGVLLLLCFTFFFRLTLTPGEPVASLWVFSITQEGIHKAIRMTVRIALMISAASLLSYTATPRELSDGLEKAGSIFKKVGVPVHSMSVMLMIAFRFIPVFLEEMNILMDAQAARGADFENGSIWKKCRNVGLLMMPLFFSSVRRASDLAMAMEARGYEEGRETTRMFPLEYRRGDRIARWGMLVYMAAMLVLIVATRG